MTINLRLGILCPVSCEVSVNFNKYFQKALYVFAAAALFTFCVSKQPPVTGGIQPNFSALNPSRVLAVPHLLLPSPIKKSVVDVAVLEVDGFTKALEQKVLEAFKNQPSVNGVTFNTVRKGVANTKILSNMQSEVSRAAKVIFGSANLEVVDGPKQCANCKTIADYYVYSLRPSKKWREALNELSAKVLNSDAALLIYITHLQKNMVAGSPATEVGLAVQLVDTNNGELIWTREKMVSDVSSGAKKTFPEWSEALNKLLDENFWKGFPGRRITTPTPTATPTGEAK